MVFWEIIWAIMVVFSLISFTFMSIKILFSGYSELKYMLSNVENEEAK